ncbi:hypothetical protein, partial [Actinomyces slackii]|uniref:hypothetical protein n=1 Tax=Actinomyces slackii TaxID=52774 RepID=UPI0039EAC01A
MRAAAPIPAAWAPVRASEAPGIGDDDAVGAPGPAGTAEAGVLAAPPEVEVASGVGVGSEGSGDGLGASVGSTDAEGSPVG